MVAGASGGASSDEGEVGDAAGTPGPAGRDDALPGFFTMAVPLQPLLLIHESHHGIAGEHSSDVAYNYTRLLTH